MSDYLAHYGRKGMKWGKNIFKNNLDYMRKSQDLRDADQDYVDELGLARDVASGSLDSYKNEMIGIRKNKLNLARAERGDQRAKAEVLKAHARLEQERRRAQKSHSLRMKELSRKKLGEFGANVAKKALSKSVFSKGSKSKVPSYANHAEIINRGKSRAMTAINNAKWAMEEI